MTLAAFIENWHHSISLSLSLSLTDSWTGCFCGQGQASRYGQSRLSRNCWQHSTSIWEPENNRKPGQWL